MELCLVTAFLDIGREGWVNFQRSIQQYILNFQPYTKIKHEIIVFMDDRHIETLKNVCINTEHIRIIPINRQWLQENIHAYQYVSKETEIMKSQRYQSLVSHRLHHPECCQPEYNIIQHSKIDFIAYVINAKMSKADYYAWTDFGFFQNPNRFCDSGLNLTKFNLEKINFQGIHPLQDQDSIIEYTLRVAPEKIGGFFYLGRKDLLLEYQKLYHQVCLDFYNMGIVDDDQHIMIQCVFRNKELFQVWNLGGWHLTYLYFRV